MLDLFFISIHNWPNTVYNDAFSALHTTCHWVAEDKFVCTQGTSPLGIGQLNENIAHQDTFSVMKQMGNCSSIVRTYKVLIYSVFSCLAGPTLFQMTHLGDYKLVVIM